MSRVLRLLLWADTHGGIFGRRDGWSASGPGRTPGHQQRRRFPRPERQLPGWRSALVVVAHPDDETFGLGALIAGLTASGTAVHMLCFTRGEASTLNENDSDLLAARARELRQAAVRWA